VGLRYACGRDNLIVAGGSGASKTRFTIYYFGGNGEIISHCCSVLHVDCGNLSEYRGGRI
jgi:hypothetical protein